MTFIHNTADLLRKSAYTVFFTGAGVSTASGIPDFRSRASGLWRHTDPMRVASLYGFRQDPNAFYNWLLSIIPCIAEATPNAAHRAIAELETMGLVQGIITQNIDDLHQAAGNRNVFELHGQMKTATCTHCFTKYDAAPLLDNFLQTGSVPRCDCQPGGAVIKPDVILFGEQLPYQVVRSARHCLQQAELVVVIGSSLRVEPANQIPLAATKNGAKLVVMNLEPTPADPYADEVAHDDVNTLLPEIVRELK